MAPREDIILKEIRWLHQTDVIKYVDDVVGIKKLQTTLETKYNLHIEYSTLRNRVELYFK